MGLLAGRKMRDHQCRRRQRLRNFVAVPVCWKL